MLHTFLLDYWMQTNPGILLYTWKLKSAKSLGSILAVFEVSFF
jgi:hypothetical protein